MHARKILLGGLVATAAIAGTIALASPASATTTPARHFQNCTAMHRVYPHGVGRLYAHDRTSGTPVTNFKRSDALYSANQSSDRDHDHIACEAR